MCESGSGKVLEYCSGAQVKSVSNQGNLIFCLVSVYKKVQSGCDNDDNDNDCSLGRGC